MQLFSSELPEMHIQDILKCTIDPRELSFDIPAFYRQVLLGWYEIKANPKSAIDIRRECLWYNKNITINGNCTFSKSMYKCGILLVHDIVNSNGTIMSHDALKQKYDTNINFLNYHSLTQALPSNWKKILKSQIIKENAISKSEAPHLAINGNDKNIKLVETKEIYLTLLSKNEKTPSCVSAWNERLQENISEEEWAKIFTLPRTTTCETSVLNIQYKILHRCYATNSKISKWDNTKSEMCNTCNLKANISHNFYLCAELQHFWYKFETWYVASFDDLKELKLSITDVLFGKHKNARYDTLNHALLYAKYFIHKQFIQNTKIHFENFKHYYNFVLKYEKQRYIGNDCLKAFEKRFKRCKLLDHT